MDELYSILGTENVMVETLGECICHLISCVADATRLLVVNVPWAKAHG